MRIAGLVISTPDVAATQTAWRRLGISGIHLETTEGEAGVQAVVLAVPDVRATEHLLRRRGLVVDAEGFDLHGVRWRVAPGLGGAPTEGLVLDHLVVRTGKPERAVATYGGRLGLDLRLDRTMPAHGFRGLFFRCGEAVLEVIAPDGASEERDAFGGAAWRTPDLEATRERLVGQGVEVSGVRPGRKPGTRVATVRDRGLVVPTLLIETER